MARRRIRVDLEADYDGDGGVEELKFYGARGEALVHGVILRTDWHVLDQLFIALAESRCCDSVQ